MDHDTRQTDAGRPDPGRPDPGRPDSGRPDPDRPDTHETTDSPAVSSSQPLPRPKVLGTLDGRSSLHSLVQLTPEFFMMERIWAEAQPYQRALLRTLAVGYGDRKSGTKGTPRVDLADLIEDWASDIPYSVRREGRQLAQATRKGDSVLDALDRSERLLPAGLLASFRLAAENDRLAEFFDAVLAQPPQAARSVSEYHLGAKLLGVTAKYWLVLLVAVFMLIKVVPEVLLIAEEFDSNTPELGGASSLLNSLTTFLMTFVFPIFMVLFIAGTIWLTWRYRSLLGVVKRFKPINWQPPPVMTVNQRRRLLAYALNSQAAIDRGLAAMATSTQIRKIAPKLNQVFFDVQQEHDTLESMKKNRLITPGDYSRIAPCSPATQAWLLNWRSDQSEQRVEIPGRLGFRTWLWALHVILIFLIAVLCLFLFGFMTSLLDLLSAGVP